MGKVFKVEEMLAAAAGRFPAANRSLTVSNFNSEKVKPNDFIEPYIVGENSGDIRLKQGVVLRYILEVSGLTFAALNVYLGEENRINPNVYKKFIGKSLSKIQCRKFLQYIRMNISSGDSLFSGQLLLADVFQQHFSNLEELESELELNLRDLPNAYMKPFFCEKNSSFRDVNNNIVFGLNNTDEKAKIESYLSGNLLERQQITCIYGRTTVDDRKLITDCFKKQYDSSDDLSVFIVDLHQFENSRHVLIYMLRKLQGGSNSPNEFDKDQNRSNNQLFTELRKKLKFVKFCYFVFYSFKYSDTEGESDLPINHAIIGKDWIKLINALYDLSGPLDSSHIHIIISTDDSPGRFENELPLRLHVIDLYAPSARLFEDISKSQTHRFTSELLMGTCNYTLNMRQIRLLSILEPNKNENAYRQKLNDRLIIDKSLIDAGEVNTVIYQWLKMWIDTKIEVLFVTKKIVNVVKAKEAIWLFLVLCAISADGIDIPLAQKIILKLLFPSNKILDLNLTNVVNSVGERILFTLPNDSILQKEEVVYFFSDSTLKELLLRHFRDESGSPSDTHYFSTLIILRARLELAKTIFMSLQIVFGGCFFKGIIKQKLPSDFIIKRISMLVDNLLQMCDPRLGCDIHTELSIPKKNNFSDLTSFENMCDNFLDINITDIQNSKQILIKNRYTTLEYLNIPLLRFCMQLIYFGLDLGKNWATTRFIEDGDKIRYSLLKRFFQIRGNGSVFRSNEITSSTVFSVLPQSVIAALRDKKGESTDHFFRSLLTSAKRLDKIDDCISILSQTDFLRHVREAHEKSTSDKFESFTKINDHKNLSHFTVLKLKVYLLCGYLDAVRKWGEYLLDDKSEPIYLNDRNITKSRSVESLLITVYIAQAKYGKALERIEKNIDVLCVESKSALTQTYSACIRLKALSATKSTTITNNAGFREIDVKVSSLCEEAYSMRGRFSNLVDDIYDDEDVVLSDSKHKENLELRTREHISIAMLKISDYILQAESVLNIDDRRYCRADKLNEIKLLLRYIDKLKRINMLPIKNISYEVGYFRYCLYKSFCKHIKPTERLLARIKQLSKKCFSTYPLYYCQLLILETEYLRQHNGGNTTEYEHKLIEIENLILKFGYHDRFFELYCLRDERENRVESRALWLVV